MEFFIVDGTGKAYPAKVNELNQLVVLASAIPHVGYISQRTKRAYEFHPPRFTILQANGEMPIAYITNNSVSRDFVIHKVKVYWNGGAVSPHDKVIQLRTFRDMATPTTNITSGQFGASNSPHNLNLGSNLKAEITFLFWDKLGTLGMTIANAAYTSTTKGAQINCGFFRSGYTPWDYEDALILSPGAVLGITAEAAQGDGDVIIVIVGYHQDVGV